MWADLRGQVDDLCDLPAGQIQDHQLAGLLLMDVVEAVAVRQRDVGQTALAIVPDLVRLGRELDARRLGEGREVIEHRILAPGVDHEHRGRGSQCTWT